MQTNKQVHVWTSDDVDNSKTHVYISNKVSVSAVMLEFNKDVTQNPTGGEISGKSWDIRFHDKKVLTHGDVSQQIIPSNKTKVTAPTGTIIFIVISRCFFHPFISFFLIVEK